MSLTLEEARHLLKRQGLRATTPRVAVLKILFDAQTPLSYSEMVSHLSESDWDPTTIYRNLVKLSEAGIATIVSRAGGISRYALVRDEGDAHRHPHFVCDDCGKISCLPAELTATMSIDGDWSASIAKAMVQLRGECPKCLTP
jgi:Fur family transcriptional regulator, ferric uptake regulator